MRMFRTRTSGNLRQAPAWLLLASLVMGGVVAPVQHILWMQMDDSMSMSMSMSHGMHTASDGPSVDAPVECAEECPILALLSGQSQGAATDAQELPLPRGSKVAFSLIGDDRPVETTFQIQARGPPVA